MSILHAFQNASHVGKVKEGVLFKQKKNTQQKNDSNLFSSKTTTPEKIMCTQ